MKIIVDLTKLPEGRMYEDTYHGFLSVFRKVAESKEVKVLNPPRCWVALLLYLGAEVDGCLFVFECDWWIADPFQAYRLAKEHGRQREYVEHTCTLRPELIDALWKADCEWLSAGVDHTWRKDFVVTNQGSYNCPELQEYFRKLDKWKRPPEKRFAVVTNCAADKPYPAPLHRAILKRLPDPRWTLLIVTGVLGLLPLELWEEFPIYDAGLPNFWRCLEINERVLSQAGFDALVIYTEFYSPALIRAIAQSTSNTFVQWVLPCGPYKDYLPLTEQKWLSRLEDSLDLVSSLDL